MSDDLHITPPPSPEVLRLTALRSMAGYWRGSGVWFTRHANAPYLALGPDALWAVNRGQVMRWPLQAVADAPRGEEGREAGNDCLHLQIAGTQGPVRQSFRFTSSDERDEWYQHIQTLKKQLPDTPPAQARDLHAEPVVVLRKRPSIRFEELGRLDGQDLDRTRAEVGLQVRAAMLGADALVDVRHERPPEPRPPGWRYSGTAIRALDAAGKSGLRARGFAQQASRVSSSLLVWILTSWLCTLLGAFLLGHWLLPLLAGYLPDDVTLHQFVITAAVVTGMHAWPFALVVLLRLLRWPQLVRPAGLSSMVLAARALLIPPVALAAVLLTGKWWGAVLLIVSFLDPINLILMAFGLVLCRRALRTDRDYRRWVPALERRGSVLRAMAGEAAFGVSAVYAVLLVGYLAWGQFAIVRGTDRPTASSFQEHAAEKAFAEGRDRAVARQPQEAEQAYRKALRLYQELVAAYPSVADHRHHLAATYGNLGLVLMGLGEVQAAEDHLREQLSLFAGLADDYPTDPTYAHGLMHSRRILEAVRTGRFVREFQEADRLKKAGQSAEAEKAFRKLVDRCEKALAQAPASPESRRQVIWSVGSLADLLSDRDRSAEAAQFFRRALEVQGEVVRQTPNQANQRQMAAFHNGLAWVLATSPDLPVRDPAAAIAEARKALELAPQQGSVWNTLGVAQYRAGDWKAAIASLEKSMELRSGGDSFDWFFLAMAHAQCGERERARAFFDRAGKGMERMKPQAEELRRLRAEAAGLLGVEDPPRP
jgi:tetratricopeptide (TPR) repeat protein